MGHVIEGRARYLCETRRWSMPDVDAASVRPAKVAIVAASQGEGPDLVEAVAERNYAGLVVQATGAGHLHHSWVEPLAELSRSIPVVLATRVSRGPVLSETYAFRGSESDLLSRGLISAGFGPFAMGWVTDNVFADKQAIHYSMALVTFVTGSLGTVLIAVGLRFYRESLKRVDWA